ncbi:MAG: hypothetical protein KDC87_14835 [Planctomycetes bacterium]|nr:hypothetical protein [Planctomycetota bacterium]
MSNLTIERAARHHVHIESYIFRDDSLGRRMIGLLCEKARAGVQVRLILDGIGALLGYRLRRELARAGGHAVAFLPRLASPNLRNHRKIVVCDGAVGFFGGLNVGSEYLGRGKTRDRDWADMHMRLAGPSVWDLQWIFVEDWDFCTGEFLEGTDYFAPSEGVGEAAAQVIAGGPDERPNPVRQAFLGAFVRARRRILIATPYVVPDQGLRDVLELAARSGIEVIVVTQHPPPDHQLAFLCTLYYVRELEEAGVKVFGYRPGVMHAKAVAVDGEWAMVGTANLDNRSMFLNFEQMTLFDGAVEAAAVTAAIERLLLDSTRLDAAWLRGRPWLQRVLIQPARLLAPLM